MRTWKQIERSREIRLWVTQVIIPAIGIGVIVWETFGEDIKSSVGGKIEGVKKKIKKIKSA